MSKMFIIYNFKSRYWILQVCFQASLIYFKFNILISTDIDLISLVFEIVYNFN